MLSLYFLHLHAIDDERIYFRTDGLVNLFISNRLCSDCHVREVNGRNETLLFWTNSGQNGSTHFFS